MTTVLVTGARRGIGLATSIELARRGHRVVAAIRDLDRQDDVASAAKAAGVGVEVERLDLCASGEFAAIVADLEHRHGPIDVVVHNAAVEPIGPLVGFAEGEIRTAFETNAIGPILLSQQFLTRFVERRRGRFVTISSLIRRPSMTGALGSVYGATKAAIDAWATNLAKETVPLGIDSVVVELGGFATDMMAPATWAVDAIAPADSPFRGAAELFAESLQLMDGKLPGPAVAAVAIADVVEAAEPPLRSVIPAAAGDFARFAEFVSDADFRALCLASDYRAFGRAQRVALANAAAQVQTGGSQ